jgi:hypothetical protein
LDFWLENKPSGNPVRPRRTRTKRTSNETKERTKVSTRTRKTGTPSFAYIRISARRLLSTRCVRKS